MTETIGTRIFSQSDVDWFAAASGDFNPVHINPGAARRLVTGGTVVHGMFTLLWMLERHFGTGGIGMESLTAFFPRAVKPGDRLQLMRHIEGAEVRLVLSRGGETLATMTLEGNDVGPANVKPMQGRMGPAYPEELTFSALKGLSGRTTVAWESADIQSAFPNVAHKLGEVRVAAIMALSRIVGMQAPGLHSIFTGIGVTIDGAGHSHHIEWQVSRSSVPIAPIRLAVAGGCLSGYADAIVRPAPVNQPQMQVLQEVVAHREFIGQQALVVGGSRGLGELVAKLVVAGGGEATISYLAGEDDAQRVVSEITEWGGVCRAIRLDISDNSALPSSLHGMDQIPTHLYYFPTPRIAKQTAAGFNLSTFIEFSAIYVQAFDRLVLHLAEGNPGRLRIFYPSTSFIDEQPTGFAEYVAAKAAGEAQCRYLNRMLRQVAIYVRRLPRLGTDQTASLIPQSVDSAVEAMLSTARTLHDFEKPVGLQLS